MSVVNLLQAEHLWALQKELGIAGVEENPATGESSYVNAEGEDLGIVPLPEILADPNFGKNWCQYHFELWTKVRAIRQEVWSRYESLLDRRSSEWRCKGRLSAGKPLVPCLPNLQRPRDWPLPQIGVSAGTFGRGLGFWKPWCYPASPLRGGFFAESSTPGGSVEGLSPVHAGRNHEGCVCPG